MVRVNAAIWIVLLLGACYLLFSEVGELWAKILGSCLGALGLQLVPDLLTGMTSEQREWEKAASGISKSHCRRCGEPLSLPGTIHCQILSGLKDRNQFLQAHGVLCEGHATEMSMRLRAEQGLSDEEWQASLERAAREMQWHIKDNMKRMGAP